MRCNYRHNMWCNCKKPIHHDIPVTGVGAPSSSSVTITQGNSTVVTFNYSPNNASHPQNDLVLGFSPAGTIDASFVGFSRGTGSIQITGQQTGNASVWYQIGADISTRQTISVVVEEPAPAVFTPVNRVPVIVAPIPQTRGKKVRGAGDMYVAKVFQANDESNDYVGLEWAQEGTPSVYYSGTADNEHCRAMFSSTNVTESIARNIETIYDAGLLDDGFVKFDDTAYEEIQTFFNEPVTEESVAEITEAITENPPVRFTTVKFNTGLSDMAGNVGETVTLYAMIPDTGGTWSRNPEIMTFVSQTHEIGDGYNTVIIYEILDTGLCTITFTSSDGASDSIQITCTGGGQTIPVQSIDSVTTDYITYIVGESGTTGFDYSPANANDFSNIVIESNHPEFVTATLESYGEGYGNIRVSAVGAGEATITISDGTNTYYEYVTVENGVTAELQGITSDRVITEVGETNYDCKIIYTPTNANDFSNITIESDDDNVAYAGISSHDNGMATLAIYPVATGDATITIGGIYDISVTVLNEGEKLIELGDGTGMSSPTYIQSESKVSSVTFEGYVTQGSEWGYAQAWLGEENNRIGIYIYGGLNASSGQNSYILEAFIDGSRYTISRGIDLGYGSTTEHLKLEWSNSTIRVTYGSDVVDYTLENLPIEWTTATKNVFLNHEYVSFTSADGWEGASAFLTTTAKIPVETVNSDMDAFYTEQFESVSSYFSYLPANAEYFGDINYSIGDSTKAKFISVEYNDGTGTAIIAGLNPGETVLTYGLSGASHEAAIEIDPASNPSYTVTSDTLAYFPFKMDVVDYAGDFSIGNDHWSEDDYGVWFYDGGDGLVYEDVDDTIKFASVWYQASPDIEYANQVEGLLWNEAFGELSAILCHTTPGYTNTIAMWTGEGWTGEIKESGMGYGKWHHLAWGIDSNGDLILGKDGVVTTLVQGGTGWKFGSTFKLLRNLSAGIILSDFILDGASWDAADIEAYYNATRAKYPDILITPTSNNPACTVTSPVDAYTGDSLTIDNNEVKINGTTMIFATAYTGYSFDHWEDENGSTLTGEISLSTDLRMVAIFTQTTPTTITSVSTNSLSGEEGQTQFVGVNRNPYRGADTLTITEANSNIATVSGRYVEGDYIALDVQLLAQGQTSITVSDGVNSETISIDVTAHQDIPVSSMSGFSSSLSGTAGTTETIVLYYDPYNAENVYNQITISSSDDNIVSIDSTYADNGRFEVTFGYVSQGTVTLTSYLNGNQVDTTTATVTQ